MLFEDLIEMTDEETYAAGREFHLVYGAALAEWSRLEGVIFYWFRLLTGLDEKTGRAIFFSARNFNARADMLEAALDASKPGGPIQSFLEAILRKSRGYSGFRNSATHGEAHIDRRHGSPTCGQFVVIQGRKVSVEAEATMITVAHLATAHSNFRQLRKSVYEAYPWSGPVPATLLETHHERVLELPNQPHSTQPGRTGANPKSPPKP